MAPIRKLAIAWVTGLVALFALTGTANAVPSFARQTGLACEACHTVFPQLTPFGRAFKASGYTLFNTLKISDVDRAKQSSLSISDLPPISVMGVVSTSSQARANDSNSSKVASDFPQQFSIFYAGRIADNVGAYIQATYSDQSGSFGMDNTDIRFADVTTFDGFNVVYGLSLNNNPTVQDLYNTTPAWSQPFMASPVMQSPAARAQIEGALGGQVLGLSAYAFIDDAVYAEFGVYRSALQGASVAFNGDTHNNIIESVAPYWRLTYEKDWGKNSWEAGTFGMAPHLQNPTTPGGNAVNVSLQHAPTDRFLDIGLDSQYQYIDDETQLTVTSRWTHESAKLDASFAVIPTPNSDRASDQTDFENVVASYFWHRKIGATVGFFNLNGTRDLTYFGTSTGRPDSNWGNFEIDYVPWLNVKLGLQYTAYFKFNGASSNYDGSGRNASDNNMLYGYLWVAF
jgi:hypothetical protein